MKTENSSIPLSDMFNLLKKITFIEDRTVETLLSNMILDLKGDGSIGNLKALNYFLLFRTHCLDISSTCSYASVIHESLDLLKYVSIKDVTVCALLGSVIENCLPLIDKEDIDKTFFQLIEFVETNINFTTGKMFDKTDYENLTLSLLVFEKLCSFVSNRPESNFRFPDTLCVSFVNLIPGLSIEVSKQIFSSVLSKFILSQDSSIVLEQIWLQLLRLQSNEIHIGKQLFYICLLCDHFISVTSSKFSFPLFNKVEFWEIVQKGSYNEDSLIRKQSLYLLKRYVETLEKCSQNCSHDNFYWDDKHKFQLIQFWNKIITLFEVIEEKQAHLVTPALNCFNDLYSLCSLNDRVCYSWLFCVFMRLLKHPSNIIAKWSLKEFCSIDVGFLSQDSKFKELLNCFFSSLNNMFLFNIDNNSASDFNYDVFLEKWFSAITVKDLSEKAFEYVLECLASISWSPIPLFYVTNAISKVSQKQLLNSNCLNHLNKLLIVTLKNQCIFIRSAIQCQLLKCIFQLSRNDINIMIIANILGCFSSKESLKRGTGIWKKCVAWVEKIPANEVSIFLRCCSEKIFERKKLPDIISNSIRTLARMFILITDSNKHSNEEDIRLILSSLFEQFYESDKRTYSCSKVQNNCLEFLECLICELGTTVPYCNTEGNKLLLLIEHKVPELLQYIEVRLHKGPIDNIQTSILYERTFYNILNSDILANNASVEILRIFNSALNFLTTNVDPFQEYLSLKIVYRYCNFLVNKGKTLENTPFEKEIVQNIFRRRLFSKDLNNIISVVDPLFNTRGKLVSEMMHILWCTFNMYVEHNKCLNSILKMFSISMLIDCAFVAINEDGKESLIPILKSFTRLLPFHKNVVDVKKFISDTWNACFELRKNELFWLAINEWIRMVYQDEISEIADYHELINDYAKQIMHLGEELIGLVDIFVDHCKNLRFTPVFSSIISTGLVFGSILRKDKRMELEVCDLIMSLIKNGSMESFGSCNVLRTDLEVRLKTLNLLLTLSDMEYRNQLIVCVVDELLLFDYELTKNNKRYFNDSVIHRKKNKLLQALLIIENYIFHNPSDQLKDVSEIIHDWVLKSLINSSQQPSVRYQLEWLFVMLNLHYPIFFKSFWDHFKKAGNERLGSMCSFISIAYHLSVTQNDNQFIEESIDNILPWCMSQNFNIRLYAQVLLSKLWKSYPEISKKYHCITKNQLKIYELEGNMLINAKKMENDFYFSVFHPVDNFTLQTIYWDLPRLSNISAEEWIQPNILEKYAHLCSQTGPVDFSKSLESCVSPTWIIKNSGPPEDKTVGTSIQKKFIPWKSMFQENEEEVNNQKGSLILVASLVEKAANLGGLARTCEVFAAKELVISNLDVIKEKEFISLSMTAEKHMNITEVKAHNLEEYLKGMKKMGYVLIGAEQTTGSVSLTSYNFPEQLVLLLGNEKEGIPPNLLPLLEAYIEVPQLGLVRSLNVHVTGAIFLWEYSKQHSFNS